MPGDRSLGVTVVTGGASGLGAAVTAAIRKEGGTPVVLDIREPADEVVDLADSRAAEAAVRRTAQKYGGIDAVVTCAGIDACGQLLDVPGEEWDRVIAVNLIGTAAVVRAALPSLVERHGTVVTCASTLGLKGVSDATAYCASKFGVVGFTRALAAELKGTVGVTLLVPGGMHTGFFDNRDPRYRPAPDAKLNNPEDVAEAVLFALRQPSGCEVKELIVASSWEVSYP